MYANLSEFIHMGGYGAYVWSCFGLCAVAILLECLTLRQQRHKVIANVRDELHQAAQTDASNKAKQT